MTRPPALLLYTGARMLLFIGVAVVLSLVGARGILLLVLALVVSGLLSLVLLAPLRDQMSMALASRRRPRSGRLDRAAQAEDAVDDALREATRSAEDQGTDGDHKGGGGPDTR